MLDEFKQLMNSMGRKVSVVPAIIPESFPDITEHVSKVSGVERVQIDVMDGLYTPKPSWPFLNQESRAEFQDMHENKKAMTEIDFELDLMVQDPQYFLDHFIDVGAKLLVVHIESTQSMEGIIKRAHDRGVRVCIAIRPSTDIKLLLPYLEYADSVQMMGSDKIGFHGVELDERVYTRVKDLRSIYRGTIAVDIGVNKETAPKLVEAGVDKLVSGSAIFNSGDIAGTIEYFSSL